MSRVCRASNYSSTYLMLNMRAMAERTGIVFKYHCILESGDGKGYADQTIAHAKFGVKEEIEGGFDVKVSWHLSVSLFLRRVRSGQKAVVLRTIPTTSRRCVRPRRQAR